MLDHVSNHSDDKPNDLSDHSKIDYKGRNHCTKENPCNECESMYFLPLLFICACQTVHRLLIKSILLSRQLWFRYIPCEFDLSWNLSFTQQKSILSFFLRQSVQGTLWAFSMQWWKMCSRPRWEFCDILPVDSMYNLSRYKYTYMHTLNAWVLCSAS
jgi:hypothetical protein